MVKNFVECETFTPIFHIDLREVTVTIESKMKELNIKLNKDAKSCFRYWPDLRELTLKPMKYKNGICFLKKIYHIQKSLNKFKISVRENKKSVEGRKSVKGGRRGGRRGR